MSPSFVPQSPTQLQSPGHSLTEHEKITILYKEDKAAEPRVLCEGFPKSVARVFSALWKRQLKAIDKPFVGDTSKAVGQTPGTVTVIGGAKFGMYQDIVTWMLARNERKGFVPIPCPDLKPYAYLYQLRGCARTIGCRQLEKGATKRMQAIEQFQIHSEDVRALYLLKPPRPELKKFLAEHVATRIFEKRLKGRGAYSTLREELPEFDHAINEILEKMKKEKEPKGTPKSEGKKLARGAPKQQRCKGKAGNEEAKENKTERVTLKAEVVRRAAKGRPAYARLDLGAVGVTKEQFSGRK